MIDKDLIRVDLLKFRQKVYLSYPKGSPQRKQFLKTILQTELQLSKKEIPSDLLDFVAGGKKTVLWNSLKYLAVWFSCFLISCISFFLFYQYSPLASLFLFTGGFFLFLCSEPIKEYWKYHKRVKEIQKYSNDMKLYMAKLTNEIKRLDGPSGF